MSAKVGFLTPTFNFSPYLPADAAEQLKAYQYHAEDRSYMYSHLWRPLCRWAVTKTPVWLAPNVITLAALALVGIVHCCFAYFMPDLTYTVNTAPEAVAKMSLAEQRRALDLGVPFGSAAYDQLRDVLEGDASLLQQLAAPVWLYVAGGATLLLYCFLDNLDGHQARRTGTSSPLGLLMDHGCDAVNCVIGSLSIATALGTGPTWKTWSASSCAVIVFFMNTWEEYYRGALILPVINGANEGLLVATILYFITSSVGTVFWLQYVSLPLAVVPAFAVDILKSIPTFMFVTGDPPSLYDAMLVTNPTTGAPEGLGMMLNTMAVVFMGSGAIFTSLGNVVNVAVCIRGTKPGDEGAHGKYGDGWLLKRFPLVHALTRLLPLAFVTIMANLWLYNSPAMFQEHPRIACWTFGLLYTKLVTHMMIAHLCSVEYHPLRRTLVPFIYLGGHALLATQVRARTLPSVFGDESVLLFEFFGIAVVTYLHLVVNAVVEMAAVLKVTLVTVPLLKQRATIDAERKPKTA